MSFFQFQIKINEEESFIKKDLLNKIFFRLPIFGLVLSVLSLLAIMCFHFPEIFTTPDIRSNYPIPFIRSLIYWTLILSFSVSCLSILYKITNKIPYLSLFIISISFLLGGSEVQYNEDFETSFLYFGLDWFLLDLFILGAIFIPLEAFFPKYSNQATIRPEFKTDLVYFLIGHIGFQGIMFMTQTPGKILINFFDSFELSKLHLFIQVFIALFITDFFQYWVHRSFHKIKALWHFHQIHHSIKCLDWLAGARLHLVDILITRSIVYFALLGLNPSSLAFNIYILIMATHSIYIHSNIKFSYGFLDYCFVTPRYHHWHHNDRPETYDKNFAIHFPVIDMVFGSFYLPKKKWPDKYGVELDVPKGYFKQFLWGFKKS